ncbi:MAG: lysophospholipid acyltransferase family protein [Cytophagales bacterium]
MKALTFYLTYPLIWLVSSSPFPILYKISDFLFFMLYQVFGYRKKVVLSNLQRSFPDKSDQEIDQLAREFYKYLCDLILETLKTVTWTEKEARSRVKMNNPELLDPYYEKGQSLVVVLGHLGNWEWAGPCFSLYCKHQLFVVYLPLSNPYFEKMLQGSRTKFNTKIVPKKEALRAMIGYKKTISATALIADQAPNPVTSALWMDFLNQETAVFNGPEKISKMMDYPVVYMDVNRVKRGHYEVTAKLLFDKPKETEEKEITIAFNKILEEGILDRPATWLWSHKRWKHKRPSETAE